MQRLRSFLALLGLLVLVGPAVADEPPDGLRRRGSFGVKVGPVAPAAAEAAKLADGVGVQVMEVFGDSTAADLGLKAGDLITAVGETPVKGAQGFVALLSGKKAGETLEITSVRDGASRQGKATLKERPRETLAGAEVVYGSVTSKRGRMRTLLTRPEGPKGTRRPALFVIQGLGGFSVEGGVAPGPYDPFIEAFHKRGYVTFRVEKPGQGDSEGGRTRDADFEDELDGYRQGLKALKAHPDVDPDRVLIFGHSMGGVMGPLIAAENPVKGIAVYGTVIKTWHEYYLENMRRQLLLAGQDLAEIDRGLRQDAAIQYLLLAEKKTPEEVLKAHPDLESRLAETVAEGTYMFDRHLNFFRQLAATNLPEAWSKFGGHALAVWGKADFVSAEDDHAKIAELVNRARPGQGTFRALPGIDHGMNPAETPEESHAKMTQPGPKAFDRAFLDLLLEWSDKVVGPAAS